MTWSRPQAWAACVPPGDLSAVSYQHRWDGGPWVPRNEWIEEFKAQPSGLNLLSNSLPLCTEEMMKKTKQETRWELSGFICLFWLKWCNSLRLSTRFNWEWEPSQQSPISLIFLYSSPISSQEKACLWCNQWALISCRCHWVSPEAPV